MDGGCSLASDKNVFSVELYPWYRMYSTTADFTVAASTLGSLRRTRSVPDKLTVTLGLRPLSSAARCHDWFVPPAASGGARRELLTATGPQVERMQARERE